MKVKRFFGKNTQTAMQAAKQELGADLAILSSKNVNGGVELICAIDYDESIIDNSQSSFNHVDKRLDNKPLNQNVRQNLTVQNLVKNENYNIDPNGSNSLNNNTMQPMSNYNEDYMSSIDDSAVSYHPQKKNDATLADQSKASNINPAQLSQLKDKISEFGNLHAKNKKQSKINKSTKKSEWLEDPSLSAMKGELKSLRGFLEHQLNGLAWNDYQKRSPLKTEILKKLFSSGLDISIVKAICENIQEECSLQKAWLESMNLLRQKIPVGNHANKAKKTVAVFSGSSGSGKTTSLIKMAANLIIKYGRERIVILTLDTQKVASIEQIKTYGKVLGVKVINIFDRNELVEALDVFHKQKFILIDTAGHPKQSKQAEIQQSWLKSIQVPFINYCICNIVHQSDWLIELVNSVKLNRDDRLIATHVDEVKSLAPLFNVMIRTQTEMPYYCNGQKIPDDFHSVNIDECMKHLSPIGDKMPNKLDEDELAINMSR